MEEKNVEAGCGCKMCQKFGWCPAGKLKGHKIIKFIFLIIILIIAWKLICGDDYSNKNNIQKDTIVVSGKGEIAVKPDIATISFSVMEENMDVAVASDAVNTKIAKIVANLKTNGVLEKDIKTTGYNIYPRYDYLTSQVYPYGGKQTLAGYDVTQSIEVKIRDLTKAGKIVSDLGALSVTDMSGLNFTEDKYDDLVLQARDQAIVQARSEATKLAKALGVRLVKIVGYSEGGNPTPVFYGAMASGVSMKSAVDAVLPTGENKITSNVSITYEIR